MKMIKTVCQSRLAFVVQTLCQLLQFLSELVLIRILSGCLCFPPQGIILNVFLKSPNNSHPQREEKLLGVKSLHFASYVELLIVLPSNNTRISIFLSQTGRRWQTIQFSNTTLHSYYIM